MMAVEDRSSIQKEARTGRGSICRELRTSNVCTQKEEQIKVKVVHSASTQVPAISDGVLKLLVWESGRRRECCWLPLFLFS